MKHFKYRQFLTGLPYFRIMNYKIITFGCQQNLADSEQIGALLEKQGYKPVKTEASADLVVVNACSVRKSATDRAYAKIKQNKKAGKKIILCGCITEKDKGNLRDWVDEFWAPEEYFCAKPPISSSFRAFIPIMTGCNNFCSYCVVPHTRGQEVSRPAETILDEIKQALKNGAKEIVLLGQNVNSYKSKSQNFSDLLKQINVLPGDFWLTFISNHPKDMTDEMIKTAAKCAKVNPLIHLPFQSGNNAMLKKMNRHYTAGQYKKLVKSLRAAFAQHRPDDLPLAITTDAIVGFPGETKKQFSDSAKLMREVEFDMGYLSCYSPRPGTAAAKMEDDISMTEKRKREQVLNNILKKTALKRNKEYIGKIVEVLIEETKSDFVRGKTKTGKNVKVGGRAKVGQIINVRIEKINPWRLAGRILNF